MPISSLTAQAWAIPEAITDLPGLKAHIVVHSANRNAVFIGGSGRQDLEMVTGLDITVAGRLAFQVFAKGTPAQFTITAVDQALDLFTVAGDQTGEMVIGDKIKVSGSTGNDGDYIIASLQFSGGNTIIGVAEEIPDATIDGQIAHADKVSVLVED